MCIETCYQNTGIALAVTLSMFSGADASLAAGLPALYQMRQMAFIITTSLVLFKFGWTYAPPGTPILQVAVKKWQPGMDGTPLAGRAEMALRPSQMCMFTPPSVRAFNMPGAQSPG